MPDREAAAMDHETVQWQRWSGWFSSIGIPDARH